MPSWLRGHVSPESVALVVAPFRAKGLVFQGAFAFYDQTISGGRAAVIRCAAKTRPAAGLEQFLGQSFIAGGWYDVMPILPLSHAAAHLAGLGHQRLVRDNAAWLARRDLNGVYKSIVRLATVEMVAKRLPALSMRYFDFGGTEETASTPRSVTAVRTGIPNSLGDWFMHCTEGFVPVALALAGASDVRVRCLRLSDASCGKSVDFRIEISWR